MGAGILSGLRVIEISAFIAAPLGGAALAAMGADVIRVDPPGGGVDIGRWPLHRGRSLYWAGLNQGKRSVTIDVRHQPGQEKVAKLITAPGEGGGIFLTNLPLAGWNSYDELKKLRDDLIMVVITGNRDGSAAVDYTVNAALGFPFVTGPEGIEGPVNHVLPAWDAMAGFLVATAILAAERHRRLTARASWLSSASRMSGSPSPDTLDSSARRFSSTSLAAGSAIMSMGLSVGTSSHAMSGA